MAAGFMTHITCRLTAENRDQLRNPTLCYRVWATFTFYIEDRVDVRDRVRQMSGGTNIVYLRCGRFYSVPAGLH